MTATVNLVATADAIEHHFSATLKGQPFSGIMSADFPINPGGCETKLGAWLAANIYTTRFDDDASICRILLPSTEMGLTFKAFGESLAKKTEFQSLEDVDNAFQRMQSWIDEKRKVLKVYGAAGNSYRTIVYPWPVFGSRAANHLLTTEGYFDFCAAQMRATGGVILSAGLSRAPLPASLARTMASKAGGGDALIERYLKHGQ